MLVNIVDRVQESANFWTWIWANLTFHEIVMTMLGHHAYSVLHLFYYFDCLIMDLDLDEETNQLLKHSCYLFGT